MSDNKIRQINEKVEIPRLRLWLVWLFLFVIPSILTVIVFEIFKEEYAYYADTDLVATCYENIKKFNDAIVPEAFLKSKINNIKNINVNRSEEELKKEIDQHICGESLFCVFFDKEVNGIECAKSNNIKSVPVILIKNYISKYLNSSLYNDKDETKKDEFNEVQKLFGNFLQQYFKTVTSITISKDEVAKNFSILYDGELYFLFGFFEKPSKEHYGFFLVLKGSDFSFREMLEQTHVLFPEIKIMFKDMDVNRIYDNPSAFYSGIKRTSSGTYIIAPTDLKFARHVIHSGKANLDKRYGSLFPFILYRVPLEKYKTNITIFSKKINFTALMLILASGVYFLYVSLFGFKENFSFKNKIMFLTLISALFPFTIFSIGIYTIENFNRFIRKTLVQQHAEIELQLVTQELNQYLNKIESDISVYTDEISKKVASDTLKPSELSEYLDLISTNIPLSSQFIYLDLDFDLIPDSLKDMFDNNMVSRQYGDRQSKELVKENDNIFILIPEIIVRLANSKEGFEDKKGKARKRQDIIEIGGHPLSATNINEALVNDGRLLPLDQFITQTWYIIRHLIVKKEDKSYVIGIYVLKFEPRPILSFFFSKCNLKSKGFTEIKGNYEINYAFLPIERSGSASIWEGSGNISDKDRDICLKSPQSEVLKIDNRLIIKKRNQYVHHLGVATITELKTDNDLEFAIKILVYIIVYLSLILYFANRLLDVLFVEPVMLLASNASAIARGSDKWDTEIKSGDEFESLNNSFKKLVTGLQERNILKSYVSEDAFSDIEESDNVKLLPGGEYIDATIVFSAIKDYDKLSLSITPQDSIKLLSKFMSIAEEATKRYGGSIDKIIGDTIMLVFRDNPKLESHGLRAAQASLEFVEKAKKVGLPKLYTGIASGRVISGRIGSYSGKLDFTVIGNPVNSAARFKTESKNGTEETGIIISGTTIGMMKGRAVVKFLRRVAIKGKARKYNIYELVGIRE